MRALQKTFSSRQPVSDERASGPETSAGGGSSGEPTSRPWWDHPLRRSAGHWQSLSRRKRRRREAQKEAEWAISPSPSSLPLLFRAQKNKKKKRRWRWCKNYAGGRRRGILTPSPGPAAATRSGAVGGRRARPFGGLERAHERLASTAISPGKHVRESGSWVARYDSSGLVQPSRSLLDVIRYAKR